MNYRIRFRQGEQEAEQEMLVEANSPTEALVKFRCAHQHQSRSRSRHDTPANVHVVEQPDSMHW